MSTEVLTPHQEHAKSEIDRINSKPKELTLLQREELATKWKELTNLERQSDEFCLNEEIKTRIAELNKIVRGRLLMMRVAATPSSADTRIAAAPP